LSFAPAKVEQTGQNSYHVSHGDDRGLWVEFTMEAVHQPFASEQEGRAVFNNVAHIHIVTPGGKSDIMRPVRMEAANGAPSDPERFPKQWAAFQNQQEQVQDGTPLEQWPPLNKAQVMELKGCRIFTLEQLAALSDNAFQNVRLMDVRKYRDMAQKYLANAKDGSELTKALAVIESQRLDIEALKTQFAELAAAQQIEAKRGPGRPRKDQNNADQE
jgi:hypothetical protein